MSLLDSVEMPASVAELLRNKVGYPIPWFVATLDDGACDFRVAGKDKLIDAIRFQFCWICGKPRGKYATFTIGGMCVVSHTSAEPPSHHACALYAARGCPFLANPDMHRRDAGLPAGVMLLRNPGVMALWTSRYWSPFVTSDGGILFDIGSLDDIQWLTRGRFATRSKVAESIAAGESVLRGIAEKEGPVAVKELDDALWRVTDLFPAE